MLPVQPTLGALGTATLTCRVRAGLRVLGRGPSPNFVEAVCADLQVPVRMPGKDAAVQDKKSKGLRDFRCLTFNVHTRFARQLYT